jgi:hypothetical protein
MNELPKSQEIISFLESIKTKQIVLQDSLMKDLDQIYLNCEQILRIFTEFMPFVSESSLEFQTFSMIISNLNTISNLIDNNRRIQNRNPEIFKCFQNVLTFPYKTVEKFSYLTNMQPPLLLSHDHVTDGDFDRNYFYKLSLEPIYNLAESFRSFVQFSQTLPDPLNHHPYTVFFYQYLRELPGILTKAQSEIIPGVMYYDFPPSILQIKQNCEKVQELSWLLDLANESSSFSTNLKIVMENFNQIYQTSQSSQKKIKFDGFMGPKSGVDEFRTLIDLIEKIRKHLPKNP